MATTLTVPQISAGIRWTFSQTQTWGDATSQSSAFNFNDTLADGTGADQANRLYVLQSTIAGGATLTLDLAASLTDVFGSSITFARVKTFYFELTSDTSSSSVTLGNSGTAPAPLWFGADDQTITIKNGGCFLIHAPGATAYPVTATTADKLLLTNDDGSNVATIKIVIIGVSV